MEKGQQFQPKPTPTAGPVPTPPKVSTPAPSGGQTQDQLQGWQKGVNTALDILTVADIVAGVGGAIFTGGGSVAGSAAGAAGLQGLKYGAKKAIKSAVRSGVKQVAKDHVATPPKATTSGTATEGSQGIPKLDDIFKPKVETGTTKAPKADTTMGQIKDLFVPPKVPTKTKPLDDLFFPGAGKGAKGTKNKTKTKTTTKTEEEAPATTKPKEEEATTGKSGGKAKAVTRLGKGALGLAGLAASSLLKDGKDEERWKASGVV